MNTSAPVRRRIPSFIAMGAALLALCLMLSPARAAVPGLIFTTGIANDANVTASMAQIPISTLNLSPFNTAVGSPPVGLRFTTAGNYKVVGQFLITSDLATLWSFGFQLDYATPGTYALATTTTPMTFVTGLAPNTYVATVTIDSLPVSVGDTLSIAASVRPQVAGTAYTIAPKMLHGLAGTIIAIQTLP